MKKILVVIILTLSISASAQRQFTNNGNFTIHSGTRISFFGDIINNSSLIDSGQVVSLSGSVAQNIGGTNTISFNNLTLNNSSGGITLNTPEYIAGTMTLTNGILKTTATNILILNAGSIATSGNSAAFIDGPMTKKGNTVFVFPLGNNGVWARLGISAPATVSNQLTAQYFNVPNQNTTSVNAPLSNISTIEYWTLGETASSDALDVTLYWQNAAASGIKTYDTTLRVAYWNGTAWDDKGQSAIIASSPGNITSNVISNFSSLTFGSINYAPNPLPVSLLSFNAILNNNGSVDVRWSTASQVNSKEFTIERTANGISYDTVAIVAGAGNSSQTLDYLIVDEFPMEGVSYYRLKQTDFDENYTYSQLCTINIPTEYFVTVFPNPTTGNMTLRYRSQSLDPINLTIIDITGNILSAYTITNIEKGTNEYELQTDKLKAGIYVLQVSNLQKTFYLKLVKE